MQKDSSDRSESRAQKSPYDGEMLLRLGCAGLNFATVWIYLVLRWPMVGIVFGWVPAIAAAVIGFFAMDIFLGTLT